ncbi:MAG: hypothetical protein AAF716_23365 [Cyanobacteria bacterium P01_D01_bin.1]
MQTITAKVQVSVDHTVTVQLPSEVKAGEYEIVLVLSDAPSSDTQASETIPISSDQDNTMTEAWERWIQEVEQLTLKPAATNSEYSQHLIEKYRQQGLEL